MSQDKKKTQWHPLFAELLRPLLQDYYEVKTDEPVGDLPRTADILLLRRISDELPPFRGLWRHLTAWNVLEFKGPTEDARLRHLPLLVELGLGIDRRLNEERKRQRQTMMQPGQVSFWYVARILGPRFLAGIRQRLGHVDEIEIGLWRSQVLQHLVFLVSSEAIASEPDSVPLHLLLKRSPQEEHKLGRLVVEQPHFLEWYASFLSAIHPQAWEEVRDMAASKTKTKHLELDFNPLVEDFGMEKLIEWLGVERVVEALGPKKMIGVMGVDRFLAMLSPAERKKLKEHLK